MSRGPGPLHTRAPPEQLQSGFLPVTVPLIVTWGCNDTLVVYLRNLSVLTSKRLSLWSHPPCVTMSLHWQPPSFAGPSQPALQSCSLLNKVPRPLPKVRELPEQQQQSQPRPHSAPGEAPPGLLSRESHKCMDVAPVKTHYSVPSAVGESGSEQSLVLPNLLSFSSAVMSRFALSSSDVLAKEMPMKWSSSAKPSGPSRLQIILLGGSSALAKQKSKNTTNLINLSSAHRRQLTLL